MTKGLSAMPTTRPQAKMDERGFGELVVQHHVSSANPNSARLRHDQPGANRFAAIPLLRAARRSSQSSLSAAASPVRSSQATSHQSLNNRCRSSNVPIVIKKSPSRTSRNGRITVFDLVAITLDPRRAACRENMHQRIDNRQPRCPGGAERYEQCRQREKLSAARTSDLMEQRTQQQAPGAQTKASAIAARNNAPATAHGPNACVVTPSALSRESSGTNARFLKKQDAHRNAGMSTISSYQLFADVDEQQWQWRTSPAHRWQSQPPAAAPERQR